MEEKPFDWITSRYLVTTLITSYSKPKHLVPHSNTKTPAAELQWFTKL